MSIAEGERNLKEYRKMGEDTLQKNIIDIAHALGWKVAHFRPAKTEKGWRTCVSADGTGWPDLALARNQTVIFLELKSEKGKVRPEQQGWLDVLPNAYVVFPEDWYDGTVEKLLR